MKKLFFPALVCIVALSACQQETTVAPAAPVSAEVAPASLEPSAVSTTMAVESNYALTRSAPISTDGLSNFTIDCNLEGVDGILFTGEELVVSKINTHEITGWLINPQEKTTGNNLKLVIAGVGEIPDVWTSVKGTRIERAGVAETRGYTADLTDSGFSFKVELGQLVNGNYHVYVMMDNTGTRAICDPGRQIKVTD